MNELQQWHKSVSRYGKSTQEFQIHAAVAGLGGEVLGGILPLLDRAAAPQREAVVGVVGHGHTAIARSQVKGVVQRTAYELAHHAGIGDGAAIRQS